MTEPSKPATGDPMTEKEQIERERLDFEEFLITELHQFPEVARSLRVGDGYHYPFDNLYRAWKAGRAHEAELRECLSESAKGLPHAPHTRSVKGGGNEHDPRCCCNECWSAARLLGREAAQ